MLKLARHQCQGKECKEFRGLQVHHKVPIAKGGSPFSAGNLIVLCRRCHELAHGARPVSPARREWTNYLDRSGGE